MTIAKKVRQRISVQGTLKSRSLFAYLLIAPLLLWVLVTVAVPLIYSVYVSLTNAGTIGTSAEFIGLDNYVKILGEPEFRSAFMRSIVWTVANSVTQVVLAFSTALILNQAFRGQRLARTWVVLPWIIPTIVIGIVWRWMLNASYGIVNFLITSVGIADAPIAFLGSPSWALPTTIAINSWRWFPFLAIIILAGLQSIPAEYYEAARVDGANAAQRFFHITLPLLQPILFVLGLIGTLLAFNVFDVIWLLTEGGPSNATETLPVLVYDRAFNSFALGEASAISVLLSVFLLAFAMLFVTLVPSGDTENEVI